jgi:hypothetical protein
MRGLLLTTFLFFATASWAQVINVPPDMKDAFQKSAMRLAFADGCDKRLDRPEMFIEARNAFARVLAKAKVPDPEARAAEIAKTIRDRPQEKETSSFSLFNEKMCGDVAKAIKDDLGK